MQLPEDFIIQMQGLLGESAWQAWLNAFQQSSPVSVRENPFKGVGNPIFTDVEPVLWADNAHYLPQRPLFTGDPRFHAGAYYVQEASSMFLEQAIRQSIDVDKPLRVLDLCAAPGGKSTQIASLISKDSLLVCNEVIRSRSLILAENIQKWGTGNAFVSNNDPKDFAGLPAFFDLVVVDAPCSGEGMFRKAPHSMEEWSTNAVQHCALRQERILHDIWNSLRPGGTLIYSTCTYNKQENEQNLLKFREQCPFESLKLSLKEEWNITETTENGIYGYRFYPHHTQGEGFFISVLRKEGEASSRLKKLKKKPFTRAKTAAAINNWLDHQHQDLDLLKIEDLLLAVHPAQAEALQLLETVLKRVYTGLELALDTRKGLKPLPAAALWKGLNISAFATIDLDRENALKFLKLEPFESPDVSQKGDWELIRYDNFTLGWVKRLKNRVNNYYPKHWKIRMSLDKLF